MKPSTILYFLFCILYFFPALAQDTYTPDWQSLARHEEAPEWFLDAKLGIYFHWGVYSVPAYNSEWYPRNMHRRESPSYKHHVETYGEPSEFGYHDFVPMFKAEQFDADEWAELFQKAGARFAGPVAEHHDGFSMWDSEVNPWNAKDMGPKRDITGEMSKALRERGMKFITSFHHAFNHQWHIGNYTTGYYPKVEGWPTASDDPELRILYGNLSRKEFLKRWKGKLFEVIDKYQPDLIWFDFVLGDIEEDVRREFLAYYFNQALRRNQEVVVTFKQDDLPRSVGVEDFEKGRLDHLTDYPWLTDDTISWGSWSYTDNLEIKTTETVVHTLIDIVSKNGVLLLNVSPKADGTIPDVQKNLLLEMGSWLETNGEAIYETRPWLVYGEGPTGMGKSGAFVGRVDYTSKDIRFTRSKDGKTVYAIVFGMPDSMVTIESFLVNQSDKARIEILGHKGPVPFIVNADGQPVLDLTGIEDLPTQPAYAFKLSGFGLTYNPAGLFASPQTIRLTPDKATLEGRRLRAKGDPGQRNIGFWDNSEERIHWLLYIDQPGTYQLQGRFSAASDTSYLTVSMEKQSYSAEIPKTDNWYDTREIGMGRLTFKDKGIYRLTLQPTYNKSWHPVDVFGLRMVRLPK